ncbi:phage tail tube protein [Stutzerimonas xanthomarina]|uniref:phage tail tube protein n=1 Tax=Stutzerimonas xanthomarina TaxID=271420 RepID=UPI003AA84F81
MASGSRIRIARRPEGSTDPWQVLRTTGDGLTVATETQRSDERRDDRTRGDQKTTMINPNGTVDFELTAANFDSIMSSVLSNAWVADSLTNGVTETRWEYLKSYMDIDEHVRISDASETQLQLSGTSGQKVTGQVTVMGRGHDDEYDPSGDTFVEPEATIIMDMSNNFHSVLIDGSAPTGLCVKGFDITINGGFQSDQCAGSLYQHHEPGTFDFSGNVNFRLSTAAMGLWRKGLLSDPISLGFSLSADGYAYAMALPRVFLSGELPSGALDAILDQQLNITPARDENGVMMQIDRTVPAP